MRYAIFIPIILLLGCTPQIVMLDNNQNVVGVMNATISNDAECKWVIGEYGAWLPDPKCSPGSHFPFMNLQINGEYIQSPGGAIVGDICVSGYTKNVRDVSQKTKKIVYSMYGVLSHQTGEWEMDHIIPLTLGGDNDIKNLYPQPLFPKPGFRQKDVCESCLNDKVCGGQMTLMDAQVIMARNWTQCLSICNVKWQ
jgi:hypothetical protein